MSGGSIFDAVNTALELAPLPPGTRPPLEPAMRDAPSVAEVFGHFRRIRREIVQADENPQAPPAADTIRAAGCMAVGILLGGGFPGSAAAVSVLLEREFTDQQWPWEPVE